MGLARKIAVSGVGITAAIIIVAILAKKTNLLEGVKSGLANIGSSLGSGLGQGLRNLGTGFVGDFTGIGQTQAGNNLLSNFAGLNDLLRGINPFADPNVQQAYAQAPLGGSSGSGSPPTADNIVVNQANRETIDKANVILNAFQAKTPLISYNPSSKSIITDVKAKTPTINITSPKGTTSVNYTAGSYAGITKVGGMTTNFAVSSKSPTSAIVTLNNKTYSVGVGSTVRIK